MGWAAGFQAGTSMAKDWIDIYDKSNERRGLKKIQDAQAETSLVAADPTTNAELQRVKDSGRYELTTQNTGPGGLSRTSYLPKAGTPESAAEVATRGLVMSPLDALSYANGEWAPASDRKFSAAVPAPAADSAAVMQRPEAGLTPRVVETKQTTKFLGNTYDGVPDEATLRRARMRATADFITKYRPEEALRLQAEMDKNDREAELHPLRRRGLEQGVEQTDFTLRELQRSEESKLRINKFLAARREFADRPIEEQKQIARDQFGLDDSDLMGAISTVAGVSEAAVKATTAQRAEVLSTARTPEQLIDIYNRSPLFSDGFNLRQVPGPAGKMVLQAFSESDPNTPVGPPRVYDNPAQAFERLRMEALAPENVADYERKLQDRQRDIEKHRSGLATDAARRAELYSQARLNDRLPPDRSSLSVGFGAYKKGAQAPVWVRENGRLVLKNGTYDGQRWGDGKNPFPGTAIPASMLDMEAIDKQAAADAKLMAGTKRQQLDNGKTTTWKYQDAFNARRAELIQGRVDSLANGILLDAGDGGGLPDYNAGAAAAGAAKPGGSKPAPSQAAQAVAAAGLQAPNSTPLLRRGVEAVRSAITPDVDPERIGPVHLVRQAMTTLNHFGTLDTDLTMAMAASPLTPQQMRAAGANEQVIYAVQYLRGVRGGLTR